MIELREPIINGTLDAFKWWLKSAKKEKPFLKTPNFSKIRKKMVLVKDKDVPVISVNKDELTYLRNKLLTIDAETISLEKSDIKKYYFTATTHKIFALKKEMKEIEDKIKVLEKSNPEGTKTLMTYKTFCTIIEKYNQKVIKALVEEGASIKLWNNLGYLYILKKDKKDMFGMNNIDWSASNAYKQELIDAGETPKDEKHPEGKNWFQFYEDPHYLRVAWTKKYGTCKVPNNSVYAFYPTKSRSGISNALTKANRINEYLREKYITIKKTA